MLAFSFACLVLSVCLLLPMLCCCCFMWSVSGSGFRLCCCCLLLVFWWIVYILCFESLFIVFLLFVCLLLTVQLLLTVYSFRCAELLFVYVFACFVWRVALLCSFYLRVVVLGRCRSLFLLLSFCYGLLCAFVLLACCFLLF